MNKMEETRASSTSEERIQHDRSNINHEKEIYVSSNKEKTPEMKADAEMEDELRDRKTSGYFIHEFITRNGWNVEKLPTFHHLHVSELTHGVIDFQDKMHSEFVRQWRRVVTGDPNKYALNIFKFLIICSFKFRRF